MKKMPEKVAMGFAIAFAAALAVGWIYTDGMARFGESLHATVGGEGFAAPAEPGSGATPIDNKIAATATPAADR